MNFLDVGVVALLTVVIPHQNHVNLVDVRLRNVQHLVQGVLAKSKYLIGVDILKVQDLSQTFNWLDEASSLDFVVLILCVVETDDLLVLPLVKCLQLRQLLNEVNMLVLC